MEDGMKTKQGLMLLILTLAAASACAQTWPAKPVRMIASVGPGQAGDIVARSVAIRLSQSVGQSFVVENVPGAGGISGTQMVARANPDGYTLLFTGGGALVMNLFVYKNLPYDPAKELMPVAGITRGGGFYVTVPADSPFKSFGDIVSFARANPNKLSYGVDTSNIYTILLGRIVTRAGKIDMVEVPYKAVSMLLQDATAGRIDLLMTAGTSVDNSVRAGKLRRIAVSSEKRNPFFTDLPTVGETLPGIHVDGAGLTLVAPAGIPGDILGRLNRAVGTVMKEPEFVKELASRGQMAAGEETPQQLNEDLREQRRIWGKLLPELGIQPQ
jgi:tripartite-type tricarboxylate transporter receptor subunit TctC